MANKSNESYKTLAVKYIQDSSDTAVFSIDKKLGAFIDLFEDTINWVMFDIFGVPESEEYCENVHIHRTFSLNCIGGFNGCHIPFSLINNLHSETYSVCKSAHDVLEELHSIIQDNKDIFGDISLYNDIFYIDDINFEDDYENIGYEKSILLQLPAIIVKTLHVFPSLLMYDPHRSDLFEPAQLYKLYESAGFKIVGDSGWLYKKITSIYQ